ncbi:hypothetical protein GOBAR_AA39027 [Gossypium barbadense]|uniref:SWIM-type domain-containing protein n=1 Tax=Gossypium barbadense TaxID=3634 RepID=A0A2P5VS75_GOSBA|nr:hypothetical protein GOBAR_AA39027 [Gossypium barbadense]
MGLKQAKQLEAGHVYVEKIRDAMKDNTQRARRCECGMFQALRYPCAHVVAAYATYSLNVEQYIDDVYTLERTLHIWGNERVKGRPTITRIRNDMDVREQVDPKRCTICRTVGHN